MREIFNFMLNFPTKERQRLSGAENVEDNNSQRRSKEVTMLGTLAGEEEVISLDAGTFMHRFQASPHFCLYPTKIRKIWNSKSIGARKRLGNQC